MFDSNSNFKRSVFVAAFVVVFALITITLFVVLRKAERADDDNSIPSAEELDRMFRQTIRQKAVKTNTIEIQSGCKLSPEIVRGSKDAKITIKNNDTINHQIIFAEQKLNLSPKEAKNIIIPAKSKKDSLLLICDSYRGGIILINSAPMR